ncbi:MAG: hypothetical protein M1833_006756 [Piccolia ochrophora]|nr:MAG: hypothetical protein M1833_006756 [Piccolia ochrophora]
MVKIKKTAGPKHEATLSPALSSFVEKASTVRLPELPTHLASFPSSWPFPRGDLYHWIPLLNRFDDILALFTLGYGLKDGPQTQSFGRRLLVGGDGTGDAAVTGVDDLELDRLGFGTEGDRELVEALLSFSRLLLENCGNRSLYSSSGHLNDLLNTTSLTLVYRTLRLGTLLAQRYHASRQRTLASAQQINAGLLASHYNIDLDKVLKLAQPFNKTPAPPTRGHPPTSVTPSKGKDKTHSRTNIALTTSALATDLVGLAKGDIILLEGESSDKSKDESDEPKPLAAALEEWGTVRLTYYNAAASRGKDPGIAAPLDATSEHVSSPTPSRRTSALAYPPVRRRSQLSANDDVSSSPEPASTSKTLKPDESREAGMKTIVISHSQIATIPLQQVLASTTDDMPKETRYDLLTRLRVAFGLTESPSTRREILGIRLLAITNLAYVYPEQVFQQKILQQDSDEPRRLQLAYQLAELVHPPGDDGIGVPRELQTLALRALEALAKHKAKVGDVCAALSVNVNHGVLLYLIRKAVSEMSRDGETDGTLEQIEWNDALFSLVGFLPTTARTGEALVSAGLLPILLDVLKLRTGQAERNHNKVLHFLDSFLYNVRDAFQTLANARGLDYISDLTAYEVESSLSRAKAGEGIPSEYCNQHVDYEIPYFQQQTLRWLFKFMNHMMSHSGGNFDRLLRNLIDSPQLLGGLRTVLSNAKVFGSGIWGGAVNIMSNFIHNEPTSYSVIAESGLSTAFLESVTGRPIDQPENSGDEDATMQLNDSANATGSVDQSAQGDANETVESTRHGAHAEPDEQSSDRADPVTLVTLPQEPLARSILPAKEAIESVPNAFGAICLNAAGLKLFQSSAALASFFEMFLSPEHVKCMDSELELGTGLGQSFDELIRHHPPLKSQIMKSVLQMIVSVGHLCRSRARVEGVGAKLWTQDQDGRIRVVGGRQALDGKVRNNPDSDGKQVSGASATQGGSEDVVMAETNEEGEDLSRPRSSEPDQPVWMEDISKTENAKQTPSVSTYLDVTARFLSGFFNNTSRCADFIELGGAEWLLDFAMLPSLEYDFSDQAATQHIARVIRLLLEQKPHLVLPSLLKRVQATVDDLRPFHDYSGGHAFFGPLIDRGDATRGLTGVGYGSLAHSDVRYCGTEMAKSLVTLHTLCSILCESFSQPMYTHRPSQTVFGQVNLADLYTKLVLSLASVHRACVLEEILLQKMIPEHWKETTRIKGFALGNDEADDVLGLSHADGHESPRDTTRIPRLNDLGNSTLTRSDTPADPAPSVANSNTKKSINEDAKSAPFKNVQTLRFLLSQVPTVITPFFQGLGKLLVAKRQPDGYARQNAALVADAIAQAAVQNLETPAMGWSGSTSDQHAYWIVMLTSLSQIMIEGGIERPQAQTLTLVLQSFKALGGFDKLRYILELFIKDSEALEAENKNSHANDNTAQLTSASGGIKIILTFFQQLVTSRSVVESTQSVAMNSRDRDREKPDYFSANQFLVELRMTILPVVQAMWDSEFVDKASTSIARSIIEILRQVFEGENESGAYKRSDKLPRQAKSAPKSWKEDSERRGQLVSNGFDKELAREAMFRCYGNMVSAEEYCRFHQRLSRVTGNPIPEPVESRRSSGQRAFAPTLDSQATPSGALDTPGARQAMFAPPTAPDGRSILLETPSMEVEEADAENIDEGAVVPPPPAPAIPPNEDLSGNEGLLAMSIDNLLGNLSNLGVPTPPSRDHGQENGHTSRDEAQSASPHRDDTTTEAVNIPGVITVEDLDEKRAETRKDLGDRCLDVLNAHPDASFEIADLIMAAVSKASNAESMRMDIGSTMVQSLVSLQDEGDLKASGKKVAAYAHLLALVLQEKHFFDATFNELKSNFLTLLGFIKVSTESGSDSGYPWIGRILLIIEKLLAEDAQPRQIKWTPPTGDTSPLATPIAELDAPIIPIDQKVVLFEKVMDILPRIGKDESLALSAVRTLVALTRHREIAIQVADKRNLQRLFVMVKQLAGFTSDKLQSAVMLVLRHIIEDEATLKQIMRSEIRTFFESRQSARQVDTSGYVRNLHHLVLRAPDYFVEVSNEMLKLVRYESGSRHQNLALKTPEINGGGKDSLDTSEEGRGSSQTISNLAPNASRGTEVKPGQGSESSAEKIKNTPTEVKAPTVEHPDGVIHYLLCELLSYKDVEDKDVSSTKDAKPDKTVAAGGDMSNGDAPDAASTHTESAVDTVQSSEKTEKIVFDAEQHPIYIYRCFVLQCLTELLSCYVRTKVEFINFSRKAPPRTMTPSKPRSGVLNYLLNDLIPVGTLNHAEDMGFRKKFSTSNWAISAIVALCSKTGEHGFQKHSDQTSGEDEPDLLFVRKFVLEHALKAYKDASVSSEPLDEKYARMLNIADMFNRMLTGKPNSGGTNASNDMLFASQKQLARIMFEKNFISAFTSSIADIDLNFPSAKRAIKYILRPLKLLTQTAIDLSESSSITTTPGQTDEDEISSATSVSEIETREETPDLFRNSTLGMFEPGREEEYSSDSSENEEMYDDDYGDEMDYEEEVQADDDEGISDEDEHLGDMEGLPGDVDLDVEVVLNGEENGVDTDGEDDESDEMDGHEDIEVVDEITGDDENDSAPGDDEGDWESQDDEDYGGADELDDDAPHEAIDNPLEHIVRALEGENGADMLEQMEGEDMNIDLDPEGYGDDDMQDEDDLSEDEDDDDGEDEEAIYEPEYDDEAGMPNLSWGWDAEGSGRGLTRGHRHTRPNGGPVPWSLFPPGRRDPGMLLPTYRPHRPTGGTTRGNDDGTNPLLQRGSGLVNGGGLGRAGRPEVMSDWVHAMEPGHHGRGSVLHANSPVSFINNLIHAMGHGASPLGIEAMHHHGGALHFRIAGDPHTGMPREIQAMLGMRRPPPEPPHPARNDPSQAVTFVPTVTSARWQEEARLLFAHECSDKTHRVINALLSVLVPPAREEERIEKEKAASEARKLQAEKEKRDEEERIAKETIEKEAQAKRDTEDREAAERAAAEAQAEAEAEAERSGVDEEPTSPRANLDIESTNEDQQEQAMQGVEATGVEGPSGTAQEGQAEASAPRVHTTIRGREVDITGMDIDPEYLDALPEELREEVLMHQVAEQRSRAASSGEQPTDISRDFLEALPEVIREELLEQEASDRRRREREEARRRAATEGGAAQTGGEDMDPASVLATLDPGLRQAILMEQDEDVLAQLPQALAAEARALGSEHRLRHHFIDPTRLNRSRAINREEFQGEDPTKKPVKRVIVQMLDKSGVATLLRLMFIPQQGSARHTLHGILRNVCENRQNRAEVVNLLLSILQDGSADVSAVERSFAQLSLRARQPVAPKTPNTPQLTKRASFDQLPQGTTDMSPLMVVQQCLSTLVLLVSYNQHIPSFFLTEHDPSTGLKRGGGRKGKAKESKSSRFALNSLLALLDRKLIMESSTVMEQLSQLLNNVTQPLTLLLKREREENAGGTEEKQDLASLDVSNGSAPQEAESQGTNAELRTEPATTDSAVLGTRQVEESSARIGAAQAEGTASDAAKKEDNAESADQRTKKQRPLVPPVVPENNLRLVVHILSARECSGKTFRDTLSTINNLSAIPGAKEVFGEELIQQAQDLGESILKDLNELIPQIKRAQSGADIHGMAIAKFSPASSDQAKLLRVLTALDYLFDPKKSDRKIKAPEDGIDVEGEGSKKKHDLLTSLYENSTFGPVWNKLSECLSAIRQRENMLNVATILLPLIEALMVVCKNTTLRTTPMNLTSVRDIALPSSPPAGSADTLEDLFFRFTEEHRKILNDLVRHSPKLMSGTFSLLVKNPKVLEFDNKRNYFNRRLHARGAETRHSQPPLQLAVRRDQVFLDSFTNLYFKSGDEMKYGKLSIRFNGEEGVDAGGVTREWFQVLSRQMFNPDYALFTPVAADRTTFHPNRLSGVNQEHFLFFKFIGRIIGKALYEGRVLDCHFSRAVYKRILGKPVSVKDMETLDLDYYKSLVWMLENDITDIITETFAVETEAFGETQVIDLKENGRNIPVTEENKHEYARLVVEYRLTGSVQEQLEHFLRGFHDIVPADLIAVFNEQELELLISGLPDIDIDDWKTNTELHNYSASSSQIQWFWRAVRSFDKEERAKLLQFVTGTSKVPLNGFKELEGMNGFSRFNIHRDYGSKDRLPSSHTCFNQLDLPEYESYEALRQAVYTAMTAGSEYFGFA